MLLCYKVLCSDFYYIIVYHSILCDKDLARSIYGFLAWDYLGSVGN
jgi:hypothetical protein